jgi:hypothetical protein
MPILYDHIYDFFSPTFSVNMTSELEVEKSESITLSRAFSIN